MSFMYLEIYVATEYSYLITVKVLVMRTYFCEVYVATWLFFGKICNQVLKAQCKAHEAI